MNKPTPEDILNELRTLIGDAEKLVANTAREGRETATAALRDRFKAAQDQLADLYNDTRGKVLAGARYTDETIREHPYPAVAVALGAGLVAGVLLSRCCSSNSD